MQKNVPLNPPATSLNPLKDAVGVTSADFGTQFDGLVKKADNLEKFINTGRGQAELIRYLPGLGKTTLSRTVERYHSKKSVCRRYV